MSGRQQIAVCAQLAASMSFPAIRQKALIDGKFMPDVSDRLQTVFTLVILAKTL
jgi:hypothetical protein